MIRKASILDLNGILEVIKDAKELFKNNGSTQWQDSDGYPNDATFINDFLKNTVIVATDNEIITGVIVVSKDNEVAYNTIYNGSWLTNSKYYTVHRIAVKKEYYQQGIAVSLLKEAEKIAIEDKCISIRVDTHKDNIQMNSLLLKMGYIKCGIIFLPRSTVLDKERIAYEKIVYKSSQL